MSEWSLLIQVPLVGIFIWYSLQRDKQVEKITRVMIDFLAEQRDDEKKVLQEIVTILRQHDTKTDTAITRMDERTALVDQQKKQGRSTK